MVHGCDRFPNVEELLWQKPSALWQLLVQVTGRDALVLQETGSYDNCMFDEASGGTGRRIVRSPNPSASTTGSKSRPTLLDQEVGPIARSMERVTARVRDMSEAASTFVVVKESMLLHATNKERSPFLLDEQVLHKSLVLINAEDEAASVGVILNRPCIRILPVPMRKMATATATTTKMTVPFDNGI